MKNGSAWLTLASLCTVPFVMVLGNSMLIPVFPKMEQAMNLSQFQVGLIVTAFSLPAGILIPFAGFLSDSIGRKKVMVPCLVLFGLGGLVAGAAAVLLNSPFWGVIGGRVIQGIGAGGMYQLAMALVGDIFQSSERSKALGLLEASNGFGKVISPILGSAAALVAWFVPFFIYSLLAFPAALGVWLVAAEPSENGKEKGLDQRLGTIKTALKQSWKPLVAVFFAGMVTLFTLFGVLSFLSDVLEQSYNLFGIVKGLVLAIPVTAMAIASYVAGLLLQKRARLNKPTIVGSMALASAVLAGSALVSAGWLLLVLIGLLGLGIGAALPPINGIVTGSVPAEGRGSVTSLYGTVRFAGVALGPPAFGLAVGLGHAPMFLGAAAIAALACAGAFIAIDGKQ